MKDNRKWIIIAIFIFLFLLTVSILAYLKLIPTEIKNIPYYDSVGHFMLFGILGLFANLAFQRRKVNIFNVYLPTGPLLVSVYAIVDETLQIFSSRRTFDLYDLCFGILGITCFYLIDKIIILTKY